MRFFVFLSLLSLPLTFLLLTSRLLIHLLSYPVPSSYDFTAQLAVLLMRIRAVPGEMPGSAFQLQQHSEYREKFLYR